MRGFTRPQNLLRSFFGLGPGQLALEDLILPTLDVQNLSISYQEQQIVTATSAAIAPGAAGTIILSMPRDGYWLLDHLTIQTSGPATSGVVIIMSLALILTRSGVAVSFGLFDGERTLTRGFGSAINLGIRFSPAVVLFDLPAVAPDQVAAIMQNPAASVGNATITISALVRQLELVKE